MKITDPKNAARKSILVSRRRNRYVPTPIKEKCKTERMLRASGIDKFIVNHHGG
jgi:hypothetical protein